MVIDLAGIVGFDWDAGNVAKNETHGISDGEAEQMFGNQPLVLAADIKHSQTETRYHALGRTDTGRQLHLTFTLRGGNTLIRVISVRDMHRRERRVYDQALKTNPEIPHRS